MHPASRSTLELVCALGALSSLGFYILSVFGVASFLRLKRNAGGAFRSPNPFPPVSILKPLKGIDPHIWESFCSHCEQDYPEYELIFGVNDPLDPAVEFVRRLRVQYPQRHIELVISSPDLDTNRKVGALSKMLSSARFETLLINDSDIHVAPDYLRRVIAPLGHPGVGMVTCLYRGVAASTLGSRLEGIGISTDFVPGVLSARIIENGIHFGLGSTLAFRRSDLRAIGGFEGIRDYLADDYELGNRIASLGKRVELSEVVVDTYLPPYSLSQFLDHQLRWARSVRGSRGGGYLGLMLTYWMPWTFALLLAARGGGWAWWLAAAVLAARLGVAIVSTWKVLDDRASLGSLYLLPIRDFIAPIIWAMGLLGNKIVWRGDVFCLEKGRLVRARETPASHHDTEPRGSGAAFRTRVKP